MSDQWRRMAMGFMGQDPIQTPEVDRFARGARVFSNAFAATPLCCPNRACLMTGNHMQVHEVRRNDIDPLSVDAMHMGKYLRQAGYYTGYIGKWHLDGGPPQKPTPPEHRESWDYWYKSRGHVHDQLWYEQRNGEPVDLGKGWQPDHETEKAMEFIKQRRNGPFALVVSYNPPHPGNNPGGLRQRIPGEKESHYSYWAPERYEALYKAYQGTSLRRNYKMVEEKGFVDDSSRMAAPGYWGACTSIDENFGKLLGCLEKEGLERNTIVVFTSDHGEMLGSHGLMGKGCFFEESLGVPMIIRNPGVWPVGVDTTLFNSVDVLPTLLGAVGAPVPRVNGHDLSGVFVGKAEAPRMAFMGCHKWRGARTADHAYVTSAVKRLEHAEAEVIGSERTHALYDMNNDPFQLKPIFKGMDRKCDAIIDDMHGQLRRHLLALGENLIAERIG